ncbi:MAG TPA: hypothetical protein VL485_07585 [Ktedonobacteraceae bacterium]|nr:hypothetical protein [Ktedonobacteraceae bacterium]
MGGGRHSPWRPYWVAVKREAMTFGRQAAMLPGLGIDGDMGHFPSLALSLPAFPELTK